VFDVCGTCNGSGYNNYGCCFNEEPDCNGVCNGNAEVHDNGTECIADPDDVHCLEDLKDVCGYCYGPGIPGGDCDCFGNIVNCAGECPTIYSGEPGVWIQNSDWTSITGVDLDFDDICDDVDDCVSSGLYHLIFNAEGSIMMEEYGNPFSARYGGYDLCGVCNSIFFHHDGSLSIKY
jgi:hypothetical protein